MDIAPFRREIVSAALAVQEKAPLVHNITNYVVMQVTANALLAAAAAPEAAGKAAKSGGKAGEILSKVVTGASALLQGTAMLTLAEETRPMDGGFILSDGAVEVNCTFDTLIRLQRGALAGEVAKVLFD